VSLLSGEVRARLVGVYTGADRRYHDLRHIKAMIGLAEQYAGEINDRGAVDSAIWFHDAVYDTCKADNESESAKLAARLLAGAVEQDRLEFIMAMILASANHRVPEAMHGAAAKDCAVFLDMDLAILGSPPAEFDGYERDVRVEYGWVPEEAWIEGRAKVLRSFLARPFVYATFEFRKSHEAAARANLLRSLARLEVRE
jgi:predicted metal-dependent HD superfamily phosphohydrolase